MAEHIFTPSDTEHPTKEELALLSKHLGHDFRGTLGQLGGLLWYLSQGSKKVDAKEGIPLVSHITQITNAVDSLADNSFSPQQGELKAIIDTLVGYVTLRRGNDFNFQNKAAGKIEIYQQSPVIYMQLFNFIQNARDSYVGEKGKLLGNKNNRIITIGAEVVTISDEELHYLGTNQTSYALTDKFARTFVRDQGRGISEEGLEDVFGGKSSKGERKGVGLGLIDYVCNCLHGFAKAESELGKGSTFSLYFPLRKRE